MRTQGGDSVYTGRTGPRRNWPCPRLDLGICPCRSSLLTRRTRRVRKAILVLLWTSRYAGESPDRGHTLTPAQSGGPGPLQPRGSLRRPEHHSCPQVPPSRGQVSGPQRGRGLGKSSSNARPERDSRARAYILPVFNSPDCCDH